MYKPAGASCPLRTRPSHVTICAPANGATVSSPVTVSAAAHSSVAVKYMQIYVDGSLKQTISASSFSVAVTMAKGTHRLTVQAKDANGVLLKATESVTVP